VRQVLRQKACSSSCEQGIHEHCDYTPHPLASPALPTHFYSLWRLHFLDEHLAAVSMKAPLPVCLICGKERRRGDCCCFTCLSQGSAERIRRVRRGECPSPGSSDTRCETFCRAHPHCCRHRPCSLDCRGSSADGGRRRRSVPSPRFSGWPDLGGQLWQSDAGCDGAGRSGC
jgi:hypothetical protein